jgi:hypothetical protein
MPLPQETTSGSTPAPEGAAPARRPVQVRATFVRLPRQSASTDE